MIFVLIAGTYTPFAALVLSPQIGMEVLIVIWIAALTGMVMQLAWHSGPRWLMAAQCLAIGWIALVALPDMFRAAGAVPIVLLVGGGALYTLGALAYVRQHWPQFLPGGSWLAAHENRRVCRRLLALDVKLIGYSASVIARLEKPCQRVACIAEHD
jgi:hemolysin III